MTARRMRTVSLALLLACAPTPMASAKEPSKAQLDEAHAHLEKGLQLYKEGAFEAALVELERAYEIAPTFKLLYNIALVQKQLNDFASALRTFERYLTEGGSEVPEAKRKETEKELATLRARVATVQVGVNVDGAEVFVDDVSVGKSPLATALTVNPGKRRIYATKEGYAQSAKIVTVAGSESTKVSLDLAATSAPPVPPPTTKVTVEDRPARKPDSSSAAIGWGVTAGLVVGGAITGWLALRASNDLKETRDAPATRDQLDTAQRKVRVYSIVTDVLFGGAIVVGAVSVWMTLDQGSKKSGAGAIRIGFAPTGVTLAGEF
jgi:hypothetical protein